MYIHMHIIYIYTYVYIYIYIHCVLNLAYYIIFEDPAKLFPKRGCRALRSNPTPRLMFHLKPMCIVFVSISAHTEHQTTWPNQLLTLQPFLKLLKLCGFVVLDDFQDRPGLQDSRRRFGAHLRKYVNFQCCRSPHENESKKQHAVLPWLGHSRLVQTRSNLRRSEKTSHSNAALSRETYSLSWTQAQRLSLPQVSVGDK